MTTSAIAILRFSFAWIRSLVDVLLVIGLVVVVCWWLLRSCLWGDDLVGSFMVPQSDWVIQTWMDRGGAWDGDKITRVVARNARSGEEIRVLALRQLTPPG